MSTEEIDTIKRKISQYCNEDHVLFDSVVDHLACLIENGNPNLSFDERMEHAWQSFDASEIITIRNQINTYNQMKTQKIIHQGLMYSMVFSIASLFTGMAIKIAHGPGALAFILLSLITATLVVFPLTMIKIYQQEDIRLVKWKNVTLVVSILLFCTGVLFKIAHWPTATFLMMSGIAIFCILFWPFSLIDNWKSNEQRWTVLLHHMLMILVALMIFGLFKV